MLFGSVDIVMELYYDIKTGGPENSKDHWEN